jgi:hypothetical protein
MECQVGSPVPEKFYSIPGTVFPLYHVLADLSDFTGGASLTDVEVLDVKSSDDLIIQGLALCNEEQRRVLIANLSPERQSATVRGLKDHGYVRILDELNAEEAMLNPEVFRSRPMEICTAINSRITLDLLPYAVATLDLSD